MSLGRLRGIASRLVRGNVTDGRGSRTLTRAYREAPGEARGEEELCDDAEPQCSSTARNSSSSNSSVGPSLRLGPVRAVQGVRRRALPASAHDPFTGNVATLLLQWPHGWTAGKARSWRNVVDDARFRQLFPRRDSPVTSRLLSNLQSMRDDDDDEEADGSGNDPGAAPYQGRASGASRDPQRAAMVELVETFKRHLRSRMSTDWDATFAMGSFGNDGDSDEDSDADDNGRRRGGESSEEWSAETRQTRADTTTSQRRTRSNDQGRQVSQGRKKTQGRRTRRPSQGGQGAAPPWDDSMPFQTPHGTVYHYWRMCPYG